MNYYTHNFGNANPFVEFLEDMNSPSFQETLAPRAYEMNRQPDEWQFAPRHRVSGNPFLQFFGALPRMNQVPKFRPGLSPDLSYRWLPGDFPVHMSDWFPAEQLDPRTIAYFNFLRQLQRPYFPTRGPGFPENY